MVSGEIFVSDGGGGDKSERLTLDDGARGDDGESVDGGALEDDVGLGVADGDGEVRLEDDLVALLVEAGGREERARETRGEEDVVEEEG